MSIKRELSTIPASRPIVSCLHRADSSALVIIVHGFASHKVGTQRSWVRLADHLASAGINAVRFDLTGCGDSYGSLEECSLSDWITDCLAVLSYYHTMGFTKIGLFGSSLGGSLSVLAAQQQPTHALAVWAPLASGSLWIDEHRDQLSYYLGSIHKHFIEEFTGMDAARISAQLNIPFLHLQADHDPIISLEHQKLFQHFVPQGHFMTIPGTSHSFSPYLNQMVINIIEWFQIHLCTT